MKGRHHCGWYYGDTHFLTKVLPFIVEGVKQNAQFLVVLEPHIQEMLEAALTANEIPTKPRTFIPTPLEELMELQREHGVKGLRSGFVRCLARARSEGFYHIRFVGRVNFEVSRTAITLEEFLKWEKMCQQACADVPLISLYMYDASLSVDHEELRRCHDRSPEADSPDTLQADYALLFCKAHRIRHRIKFWYPKLQ